MGRIAAIINKVFIYNSPMTVFSHSGTTPTSASEPTIAFDLTIWRRLEVPTRLTKAIHCKVVPRVAIITINIITVSYGIYSATYLTVFHFIILLTFLLFSKKRG